jgi:tRNA(Ile)-lysidine synthase
MASVSLIKGRIEWRVAESLKRAGFSGSGSTLVVAASGGPDSTALLRCLARLRESHGLTLHVAHLNHDFRGDEADADAAFVEELATDLGLPFSVSKQDPIAYQKERGISSFEQGAREMRYAFLAQTARSTGASAVAAGHTSDDLAETVLLHLLRGSGLHGLRGMTEVAPWPWPAEGSGVSLFRPLLGTTKDEILGYCQELGQPFREDSGNYLWRFTRNKVRHDLMPKLAEDYNPRVREALVRLARTAAEEVDFLEGELDRVWPTLAAQQGDGVRLSISGLASLHPAVQRLALRRAYMMVYGDGRRLRESHLIAMTELAQGGAAGRTLDLPGGVRFERGYDEVGLTRTDGVPSPFPELPKEHTLTIPETTGDGLIVEAGPWRITMRVTAADGEQTAWATAASDGYWTSLDRAAVGDVGVVRSWRPGDRIQPSGMQGHKKIQDLFTDDKVPRHWRDKIPLLVCDRGVAWVVGYRTAEWAKVKSGGNPTLWIRFDSI